MWFGQAVLVGCGGSGSVGYGLVGFGRAVKVS